MVLRVGGQCEGYGGLFEALRALLPVEHAWYAEIDPAASQVLAHHYPGAPNHGDITAFDWTAAEPVDIFTSGFPCQGFSMAGKRRGSEDDRHLWPTGVLPAIATLRPPLVVLENVPGLMTIEHGQVFGTVLADLDELGYTVSWTTVGACRVGACHHRHRIFLAATLVEVVAPMSDPVAHRRSGARSGGWAPAQDVLFGDFESLRWPVAGLTATGTAWELPADSCGGDGSAFPTPTARDATRGAGWGGQSGRPLSEVIALLPTPRVSATRTGRGAILNSASSPSLDQALEIAHGVLPRELTAWDEAPAAWLPTPRTAAGEKGGPNQRGSSGDVMLPAAVQPERFGKYAAAVRRHELAFGLIAPDPTEPGRAGRPRLSAEFPEWMQGLPPGWLTDVVGRKAALKLAGNGVNPRQAAYALALVPTFRAAVAALTAPVVAA